MIDGQHQTGQSEQQLKTDYSSINFAGCSSLAAHAVQHTVLFGSKVNEQRQDK